MKKYLPHLAFFLSLLCLAITMHSVILADSWKEFLIVLYCVTVTTYSFYLTKEMFKVDK